MAKLWPVTAAPAHDITHQAPLPAFPAHLWRTAMRGSIQGRDLFDAIAQNGWRGRCLIDLPLPRPWSRLNGARMTVAEWQTAWPLVLAGVSGAWQQLKADASSVVACGEIELAGRTIRVIAKRPRRTRARQWLGDLFRGGRAWRTWKRTWQLYVRGLPTEVPLLMMERRRGPIMLDQLVVFERVAGTDIFHLALEELAAPVRRNLLREAGAVLRATEQLGFIHRDAKTTNWIAFCDSDGTLRPVMLDCYGVRRFGGKRSGLKRFLKSLSRHSAFGAEDAACVCDGYAPAGWPAPVRRLYDHYAAKLRR